MPWVRLHGAKDYWGMAALLDEAPELHCTLNLVPSLLVQLAAYTERGAQDEHLRVSRLPADGLAEPDMAYLLDNFFMVSPDQMIRPYPRYQELFEKRGFAVDSAERARRRFPKRDIIDLQCWSNLVWIHPVAFERDKDLAQFRTKARHWTRGREAVAPGQAVGVAAGSGAAAPAIAGAGPGRADHQPVLPPDLAAALGQAAGARGRCPRSPCRSSSTATPTTPASRSAGRSSSTRRCSGRSRGGCGRRKARSARR